MVDQKTPSRTEQEHNREIIRAYQGDIREITGGEQVGRDSTGSSGIRAIQPQFSRSKCGGSNLPTLLDRRTCPASISPEGVEPSEAERQTPYAGEEPAPSLSRAVDEAGRMRAAPLGFTLDSPPRLCYMPGLPGQDRLANAMGA
jgi:hypothetical protein